ncbi:hypothetical protein BJV82DRAFT_340486 [Fennellomyces sp. T-0311]|nr:hypothetical protein BJV82DRAFT_340486 [Fennellomyces sp. T-0311]
MIKIWATIFDNLFAGTSIRAKWGDNQGRYSETSTIAIKVDLRVLSDKPLLGSKQEIDLVDGEFASMQAGFSKLSADHVPALVESKLLVDHMVELVGIDDLSMFVMQVHDLGLVIYCIPSAITL